MGRARCGCAGCTYASEFVVYTQPTLLSYGTLHQHRPSCTSRVLSPDAVYLDAEFGPGLKNSDFFRGPHGNIYHHCANCPGIAISYFSQVAEPVLLLYQTTGSR